MPDATITSTASTFGTISGTFAADQSTISGTISGIIPGTLTGSVGVPGPAGPAGIGLPAGGTSGQFLQKTSGVDYATDWVTVNLTGLATESWVTAGFYPLTGNPSSFLTASALTPYLTSATAASTYQTLAGMSAYLTTSAAAAGYYPLSGNPSGFLTASALTPYLTKADNLGSLTNFATARDNLQLGTLSNPTFAGLTLQGSGANVGQYTPTSLSLTHTTFGSFVISPSSGITFPDTSVQTTAFNASVLLPYAPLLSPVFSGDPQAPTAAFGDNDTSIATTAFVQAGLLGGTAVARNLEVEVRNQTGSTIAAGSIVYISGATGNKPLITLAQANNDANSAQTIGFVKTAIANNGTGFVIVRGELENIDTSALTEGVQLYLSPTVAGSWTTTKPSAPLHLVYVGIVIRSHPTLGTILVAVQNGYELNEIHDVAIGTLANNDLLAYESSTDLWKNKTYTALDLATQSWVTSQGYLPASTASFTYAALTGATFTGSVNLSSLGVTFFDATTQTTAGISPATAASTYQTIAGMSSYATLASPDLTGNVTITSNSTGAALFIEQSGTGNILTLHDQASDTTFVAIDQNGKVNTIPSTTANAGFNVPHATAAPTTPVNGDIWTTTSGLFMRQNGSTKQYVDLDGTQTINGAKTFSGANQTLGNSTAAGTIAIGSGATISGATKTVNVGTAGVSGSTTAVNIGSSVSGATSSITLNGVAIASASTTARPSLRIPHGSAPTTPTNGDLWTDTTGIFVRINGASQQLVPFTALSTYAALGSPAFTGTPTAPTATLGTNTTQIATTAFVQAAVSAGSSAVWGSITGTLSSQTDLQSALDAKLSTATAASTYAPLASPALTGTPTAPTAAVDTNTTQIATTAFVQQEVPAASTTAAGKVELATMLEATRYTSSTLATTPKSLLGLIASTSGALRPRGSAFTVANSGTGASVTNYYAASVINGPNASVNGYAGVWFDGGGQWCSNNVYTTPDWSKVSGFSVTVYRPNITFSSGNTIRITLGKAASGGTLSTRGIGVDIAAANTYAKILAHNGTTLTTTDSTFLISDYANLSTRNITMVSYGDGTVELFVNGVSYGTSSGGPTTAGGSGTRYSEEVYGNGTQATQMQLWTFNASLFTGL